MALMVILVFVIAKNQVWYTKVIKALSVILKEGTDHVYLGDSEPFSHTHHLIHNA